MSAPVPVDPDHVRWVDQALTGGTDEVAVQLTIGELFLFHCLLQDYGYELLGARAEQRFIPLMERSAARVKAIPPTEGS